MEKACRICGSVKPDTEFYPYQSQPCKDCTKERVRRNRTANLDYYQQYDRERANNPDRVAARADYQASDHGRAVMNAAKRRYKCRADRKYAADTLCNAVRDGKVIRKPCVVCGEERTDGHHFDYSRPLDVVWLCRHHHAAFHKIDREIKRREKAA